MRLDANGAQGAPADATGLDASAAASLRARAASDPKSVVKEAAKQFEALFMQQLLKGMRQTTLNAGLLENQGSQLGTEMLDGQLATKMSGQPGGLSEMIARQLDSQLSRTTSAASTTAASATGASTNKLAGDGWDTADSVKTALAPSASAAGAPVATVNTGNAARDRQTNFARQHEQAANLAAAETGIPATFMVAQAAQETGWGQHEIHNADGSTSHNLFAIKAGGNWKGAVTEVNTTEYVDGEARKVKAKFRAYASYADSFRDYANLMKDSPRYAKAVESAQGAAKKVGATQMASAASFAQGLQKAGYATDPAYADKLTRMINTTLRLQRAVG